MTKRPGMLALFIVMAGVLLSFLGARETAAFPGDATGISLTLNAAAVPSGGTGMVIISYECPPAGCLSSGGAGILSVAPAGLWVQASTCTAPGTSTQVAGFDCPLSARAAGLGTSQLSVPTEPTASGIHLFQAIFQANGALPGSTVSVCYSSSMPSSGGPNSAPALCQSALVTRNDPPIVEVKALTNSTIEPSGRVVLGATVTDPAKQPIPGIPVTFKSATPELGIPSCASNADLVTAGVQFAPIVVGASPGIPAPPGSGLSPAPGNAFAPASLGSAPFAVGSGALGPVFGTTPGSPLPGLGPQNTALGYQCYRGSAALVSPPPLPAAPFGPPPPPSFQEVSVLTDANGLAVASFTALPTARVGSIAKVIAEVYQGVSDRPAARVDSPIIQIGSVTRETAVAIRANPTTLASTNPVPNTSELTACAAQRTGVGVGTPAAGGSGATITFSLVSRNPADLDVAFAQAGGGRVEGQVTVPVDNEGCAKATLIGAGNGIVTVVATVGGPGGAGASATLTLSVNTAPGQSATAASSASTPPGGQLGFFAQTPTGDLPVCPNAGVWAMLYWQGPDTPIDVAMKSCPNAGRFWVRRGSGWLAVRAGEQLSSDQFTVSRGEAVLIYGSR